MRPDTIVCPGNKHHGPCGKPAHWRDGASLGALYPDGAWECSDTRCWTMTTPDDECRCEPGDAVEYHGHRPERGCPLAEPERKDDVTDIRNRLAELDLDPRLLDEIIGVLRGTRKTGDKVTIWPRVHAGESRDTEPGLQPWDATFVAETTDGRVVIEELGKAGKVTLRLIDAEIVR